MGILRKATITEIKIPLGDDGEDFIVVKSDLAMGDWEQLAIDMPDKAEGVDLTTSEGIGLGHTLFELFVTKWSLPESATIEAYKSLDRDAASAVTQAVVKHFQSLNNSNLEEKESKGRKTSPTTRG